MLKKFVLPAVLLTLPAWADLTLTQTMKMEMNPSLPSAAGGDAFKSMLEPKLTVMEVQGGNIRYKMGGFEMLYLPESSMMYIADVKKREYAAVAMSEWEDFILRARNPGDDPKRKEVMDQLGSMDWLRAKLEEKGKGPAATIAGLDTEADKFELIFEITGNPPNPMMAKAMGAQRMKLTYWTAAMPESLAELGSAQKKFMDMFSGMSGMAKGQGRDKKPGGMGAVAEPLMKLQKEYTEKGRLIMRMVMEIHMDFSAMGPNIPENLAALSTEPMMTMTMETKSYSDKLLEPKNFIIPVDYRSVGIKDLSLEGLLPGMTSVKKEEPTQK